MSRATDREITISEEYKTVRKLIEEGRRIILVTGKAGTGKTTLIKYLKDTLKMNTVIVAPTGVAALNAEGATIHSSE